MAKTTVFIAHALKMAAKRQVEENKRRKIQAAAKVAKRNYGRGSKLPTDTDWDKVFSDRQNRFYQDKLIKGQNASIMYAMTYC